MHKFQNYDKRLKFPNNNLPKTSPIHKGYLVSGISIVLLVYISWIILNLSTTGGTQVNKNPINSEIYTCSGIFDEAGNIYIVWQDTDNNNVNDNNIYVSRSTNNGKSFSKKVKVNDVNGEVPLDGEGTIAANGNGNVYVAWLEYREEGNVLFFDRSTDVGKTFGSDIKFHPDHGYGANPSLAGDYNNNVYVAYEQNMKVYFAKLNQSSPNFTMHKNLLDLSPSGEDQRAPSIITDGDNSIYIAWVNQVSSSNWELYFAKSTDRGYSFKTTQIINKSDADHPKIARYKNNIYITWIDSSKVYFTSSNNNGDSWSRSTLIDTATPMLGGTYPSIAVDTKGTVYVAWPENYELSKNIKIAKSTNKGKDWTVATNPGISPNSPWLVSILTYHNDVYIVWADGDYGYWNVYFAKIDPNSINILSGIYIDIILILLFVILLSFIAITATEFGRYAFIKFFAAPLYSKIKTEDILKHELRKKLYSHINSNPGDHFKSIQKNFKIGSGTLAYHISVLEQGNYIKSKRYGLYKRFYPKDYQIDKMQYLQQYPMDHIIPNYSSTNKYYIKGIENDVQEHILDVIRRNPGITQKDLAQLVGLSLTGLNYHINIMANAKVINVIRDGKWTRCYISDGN